MKYKYFLFFIYLLLYSCNNNDLSTKDLSEPLNQCDCTCNITSPETTDTIKYDSKCLIKGDYDVIIYFIFGHEWIEVRDEFTKKRYTLYKYKFDYLTKNGRRIYEN